MLAQSRTERRVSRQSNRAQTSAEPAFRAERQERIRAVRGPVCTARPMFCVRVMARSGGARSGYGIGLQTHVADSTATSTGSGRCLELSEKLAELV
jgi:hypothetical protein